MPGSEILIQVLYQTTRNTADSSFANTFEVKIIDEWKEESRLTGKHLETVQHFIGICEMCHQ